jgi:hypothetical protein
MSTLHSETKAVTAPVPPAVAKPAAAPPPAPPIVTSTKSSNSAGYSGVSVHDDNVTQATQVLQASNAGVTSQQTLNQNAITYFRSVARSAIQNNCSPSVAMQALKSLGQTGIPSQPKQTLIGQRSG